MIIKIYETYYQVWFENEEDIIKFSNVFHKFWSHDIYDFRNFLLGRKKHNFPIIINKMGIYAKDLIFLLREEKLKRILK